MHSTAVVDTLSSSPSLRIEQTVLKINRVILHPCLPWFVRFATRDTPVQVGLYLLYPESSEGLCHGVFLHFLQWVRTCR
jgi:hypothetical protein